MYILCSLLTGFTVQYWFAFNIQGSESYSKSNNKPVLGALLDTSHGMEIAQLLLSLLHSWGLDNDLDRVCQAKLGLLRPMVFNFHIFVENNLTIFIYRCPSRLEYFPKPIICHYSYPRGTRQSQSMSSRSRRIIVCPRSWSSRKYSPEFSRHTRTGNWAPHSPAIICWQSSPLVTH